LGVIDQGVGLDLTGLARDQDLPIDPAWSLVDVLRSGGGLDGLASLVGQIAPSARQRHERKTTAMRPLAPVRRPEKVIGIGLNYHDHAEETGMAKPSEPFLFAMYPNAIIGPGEPIVIPAISHKIDYEAELAIVIGKTVRHVGAEHALDAVAGYTIVNDISARDLQKSDHQWIRGKSFDTFLPMGPTLVGTSVLGAADNLGIRLRLNGKTMQESNTANLIFNVRQLVSYLSGVMTLEPGDVIATGTPGGVGFTRKPPVYLKDGDTVEVEIDEIGTLRNSVVEETRT
jgi:2-keto-4-pentenoate hydratase/2-oxohepta-3-ene-1,7-dioic acid hydratase in catechol pathway